MPLVAEDRIVRTGMVAVLGAVAVSVLLGWLGDPWRTGVAAALAVLLVAVGSPHGALDHLVLLSGPRAASALGRSLPGAGTPAVPGPPAC
jgi:hypothetical protein